jgi:uncharacterized protein (DUF2237 family)
MRRQGFREILDECGKKPVTGFCRSAFEDGAERCIRFEICQRPRIHGGEV